MSTRTCNRREFIAKAAAMAAGLGSYQLWAAAEKQDEAYLKDLELVRYRDQRQRGDRQERTALCLTCTDGGQAFSDRLDKGSLAAVKKLLAGVNLLDHEKVWGILQDKKPGGRNFLTALDVLTWDLHARRRELPLHALLGTKRQKFRTYGDERWSDKMTPADYVKAVKRSFERNGKLCTKLHLPGIWDMGKSYAAGIGEHGMPLDTLLPLLRDIRAAVGDKVAIAYDPHPQKCAAQNIDDARRILAVMDECKYEWIEAPLPFDNDDYIAAYVDLRKGTKQHIQREEGTTTAEEELKWLKAGACDQMTWDCTFNGLTPLIRIIAWMRDHPQLRCRLNLHYSQDSHQHVAAAMTDEEYPYVEACFFEGRYADGWCTIPNWVGCTDVDWERIDKNRIG